MNFEALEPGNHQAKPIYFISFSKIPITFSKYWKKVIMFIIPTACQSWHAVCKFTNIYKGVADSTPSLRST